MIKGKLKFNLFGLSWLPWAIKLKVPESYDELSHKQLLWWVEHIHNNLADWFDIVDDKLEFKDIESFSVIQIESCRMLLGVPLWLWKTLSVETLRDLIHTWNIQSFLFNSIYKPKTNPVPSIAGFLGPTKVDHFVPWEFSFADAFYLRYKTSKSISDLNYFIAQFYRPEVPRKDTHSEFTTDLRDKYNHESDILRIKAIGRAELGPKLLFLYWYEQFRNTLPKSFPYLFTKSNQKNAASSQSWLPVFSSASNGIHNLEKIKYMNLLILFAELNRLMKQQHDQEKKLSSRKGKR